MYLGECEDMLSSCVVIERQLVTGGLGNTSALEATLENVVSSIQDLVAYLTTQ